MEKRMIQRGYRICHKEARTRKNESVTVLRLKVSKLRKSRFGVIGEEALKPASMLLPDTGVDRGFRSSESYCADKLKKLLEYPAVRRRWVAAVRLATLSFLKMDRRWFSTVYSLI
jgi:hypothetical protein